MDSSSDLSEDDEDFDSEHEHSSDDLDHYPFTYNADSSRYLHRLSISEKVSDITDPVFVMTSRYNVESVRTSILYRQ